MKRTEALLYDTIKKRAEYYEGLWDFKTAISAGIAALDLLTAEQREKALSIAKGTAPAAESWQLISDKERDIIAKSRSQVVIGQSYDEIKKEWSDKSHPKPKKKSV